MTRNGKIARLPHEIRNQLNARLEDGQPGNDLVDWMNKLPDVKSVLKKEFGRRPINEQNLSEWKQGGFLDWRNRQDVIQLARNISDQADEIKAATENSLADHVATLLMAKLFTVMNSISQTSDNDPDWNTLHELCKDIVALRKGDHNAKRIEMEDYRVRWR